MGTWKSLTTAGMGVLAATLFSQQTRVVNVEQYGVTPFYSSNVVTNGMTAIGTEPALDLRFNAIWSQIGVKFTSAANWSSYTGFAVKLQNMGDRPVSLGFMVDRNSAFTDNSHVSLNLRPFETKTFYVDFSGFNPLQYGLRSPLPALEESYAHQTPDDRPVPPTAVYRCHFYNRYNEPAFIKMGSVYGVQANNSVVGLLDSFGQLSRRNWAWKFLNANSAPAHMVDEEADLAQNPGTGETLGGTTIPRTSHRGYWRVFKTSSGKSYFLSPEGRYFWSLGMCQTGSKQETTIQGREALFTGLPAIGTPKAQFYGVGSDGKRTYSHYMANVYDKFGSTWPTQRFTLAGRRLRSWGFNTVGSASDLSQISAVDVPFTVTFTTRGYPWRIAANPGDSNTFPDVFGGDFLTWAKLNFKEQGRPWFPNPMMIGVYVDGEKPWGLVNGTLRQKYQLPIAVIKSVRTQPSKTVLITDLVAKYQTIGALNATWGTSYSSWTALRYSTDDLTDQQVANAQTDLSAFLTKFATAYAYRVRVALTYAKLGLIYLGGREHLGWTPQEVMDSIVRYTDVVSFSCYDDAQDIPWEYLASLPRPVLLSEFSFSCQEGNALPQAVFPQVETNSQADRAVKARMVLDRALQTKNVIGAHWYQYVDQPITGLPGSHENYAWGMVDVTDQPYTAMVDMFRSFTNGMYLRRGL